MRCVDVEADPVVAYRQQQTAVLEGETYDRNAGPGVTRDISQSLLHNAKDAQSDIVRQSVRDLIQLHLDPHGLAPRNMLALCFQSLRQAQVVQNRRMKSIRERVHVFAQAHQPAMQRLRRATLRVRTDLFESSRVDCETCQALRHIVVQFAGKSSPLVLVSREQVAY